MRLILLLVALVTAMTAQPSGAAPSGPPKAPEARVLSLDQCLEMAMANNRRRPASQFAVAMAEAQHRQALSGYWPQVSAKAGWTRTDQPFNFLFPASAFQIPAQSVTVPGGTISVAIPAGALGPGFPPVALQVPINFPGQTITAAAQVFPVPSQDIKLADPSIGMASGGLQWLLFDGGMRKGYREQAQGAILNAKAEQRRTDLEITDSVVRLYYGAVVARQLRQTGEDTLARMEVTLELTESLFKNGSEKVNKTDFLDNQVMVETIRSMVAMLVKNEKAAEAALAYTMGLTWNETVRPADGEVPYRPFAGQLDEMVASAYEFNPDWAKLEAGLRAYEGMVQTEKAAYIPKLGLTGQLFRWWNGYSGGGLATAQNKAGWAIGAGVDIPVFNGFLTAGKVAEAKARVAKLREEKILLREGIGLQIRDLFLSLEAASKAYVAAERAMKAAAENRDLTSRAYQSELIETEKVIRAQLFEAAMTAQYLKARYDHLAIESSISLVAGKEMDRRFSGRP